MIVFAGHVYAGEGTFEEGWITLDDASGEVLDRGRSSPPKPPAARGVVIPAPVNAHTHAGDAFLRGRVPDGLSLAQVVAPPHGFKHRMLREADRAEIVAGIRRFAQECARAGTLAVLDFREGGVEGVRTLREGFADVDVIARGFGRPDTHDDADADMVLAEADGLGVSAMRDVGLTRARDLARAARAAGRAFALHASEHTREAIDPILELAPDFLVHMCAATDTDIAKVAQADVAVVICARSNARFGLVPRVPALFDAGCRVALGTDNAMFQSGNLFADLALLMARHPEYRARLLAAAFEGGRDILFDGEGNGTLAPGGMGKVAVLAQAGPDPVTALTHPEPSIIMRA